jgi:hypothetical protein
MLRSNFTINVMTACDSMCLTTVRVSERTNECTLCDIIAPFYGLLGADTCCSQWICRRCAKREGGSGKESDTTVQHEIDVTEDAFNVVRHEGPCRQVTVLMVD